MTQLPPADPSLIGPRRRFARFRPETDQEATLLTGLGMVALGFLAAQGLGSILFAPLALIVPGSVLTLVGLRAVPPAVVEEPE